MRNSEKLIEEIEWGGINATLLSSNTSFYNQSGLDETQESLCRKNRLQTAASALE